MNKGIGQLLLALVSVIGRLLFLFYRILVTGLVVGIVVGSAYWVTSLWCPTLTTGAQAQRNWGWGYLALIGLVFVLSYKRQSGRDNPYRRYVGAWGWVNKVVDRFIAWIGAIKYFTQPFSLVEDPGSYKIKGDEIRALIDGALQPGDILLRGYDGYLDGVMIGLSGGGKSLAKHFSHAALYLGDLSDAVDKPIVARRLQVMNDQGGWQAATESEKDAVRNNPAYYQAGRQRVLHSMAKGVFTEDILTFLRCDYLAVLRLPDTITLSADERKADKSLIADLPADARAIHDRLLRGEAVTRDEVLRIVRLSALGKIGSCYDFQFNDGKTHNRFSCSEFVYYCFKSVHAYIGLQLLKHGFMNIFFVRKTITPGDIYDAAVKAGKLKVVWTSRSLGRADGVT